MMKQQLLRQTIRKLYQEYSHASTWLHHHTVVVACGLGVFFAMLSWHMTNYLVLHGPVEASGPIVDMSISNTVLPEQATPGSTVTFFYYYQNESLSFNGNVPSQINVSADIPAGLTFTQSVPAPSSQVGNTLTWNNVALTDDAYGFIFVQMKIDQNPQSPITQTVSLTMPNNTDSILGNNQQSSQITIISGGNVTPSLSDTDLVVTKVGPSMAMVGQQIQYVIAYQNVSNQTATNVRIVDIIPQGNQLVQNGLIGVSASPQATTVTGAFNEMYIWNIPSLAPGQAGVITLSGIVSPGLADGFGLINIAQISSDQNDLDELTNLAYATTTIFTQGADLAVTKSATITSGPVGQPFKYNILLANNGAQTATGIVLTDTLPAGLSIVAATGATIVGNTYTWTLSQLPPYTQVLYSLDVQPTQVGVINNSASVSAGTFDPILANNTSSFPVTITSGGTNNTGTNDGGNRTGSNNNNGGTGLNTGPGNTSNGGSNTVGSTTTGSGVHGSAVSQDGAKACIYDDAQYVAKGSFTDTMGHRGFPYIEIMRVSCIHKGPGGKKGLWIYEPNRSVTRAEVLKTVVKILGIQFENFEILHEDLPYRGEVVFADTPNWFNHYAQYAYNQGLTDGLYTTDKKGNKYLKPDQAITRYEAIKVIMLAYAKLQQSAITTIGSSVLGDVIDASNPYYSYVRQAEALGFISGVPQSNGGYNFEGMRSITRAEFAKIASVPFSDQLFDIAYIVENSSLYKKIVDGLAETTLDKVHFANLVLEEISEIPEQEFLYSFKVAKDIFMDVLTEKVLTPLLQ